MAGNFDKFTERARKVLSLSQLEAERFNHPYIGTEHLLLGLVTEGDGIAARVLAELGVQPEKVRLAIEFSIGRGEGRGIGAIGLTPRAKKVVELAVDESRRLDQSYIGTEHLLLGLLREGDGGVATEILDSLGVDAKRVRPKVMRLIGPSSRATPVDDSMLAPSQWSARATVEQLELEIEQARAERNRRRVQDLELKLAMIRLRELDDRKNGLVARLISAEQMRVQIDDSIREILVEIDRVSQQRRGHLETVARTSLAKKRRKQEQQRNVENESDDTPPGPA